MKNAKFMQLTAALLIAAMLAACGGTADTADAAPADAGTSASEPAAEDAGEAAPADDGAEDAGDAAAPAPADVKAAENEIAYNGALLSPGYDVAPILETLGDGYEYSENISCMFEDGMDKTYTYPDVTIYAYPVTADQDMILMVEVTTDQVTTSRGVKLGDDLPSALLLYDDLLQSDGSGSYYTADIDGVLLTITAADGVVDTITYELAETPTV